MPEQEILTRYQAILNNEIEKQHDISQVSFFMSMRENGSMTDEDLIETRGYYKGLRVAREMLERILNEQEERQEEDDE